MKKLHKWKSSVFTIKLFKQQILIAVGLTPEDFRSWLVDITKVKNWPGVSGRETGRMYAGEGYFAMWTKEGNQRDVSHEALHIAWWILKGRGIKLDEELLAYTTGHIVDNYNIELKILSK